MMSRRLLWVVPILFAALLVTPAGAEESARDAGKHFSRGVELYNDSDYRGALVEFKRAYTLAPKPGVLYNIGQTQFQLQSWAAALQTLEKFLTDAAPNAAHRPEVEATVESLRGRVGKINVTADLDGSEVTIDEEVVGRTPIGQASLVGVGRRTVTVAHEGRPAVTRYVEVTAGETVEVKVNMMEVVQQLPPPRLPVAAPVAPVGPPPSRSVTPLAITWTLAAVLGVGTLTTGILALRDESDLQSIRSSYPTTRAAIDYAASQTRTFSLAADLLGAATIVAGAIALAVTIVRARERPTRVGIAPRQLSLGGTF
jgi:hypothetical protein